MFDTVVVATDGSESVERAVAYAADVAERFDAAVHALYVLDTREVENAPDPLQSEFHDALETRGEAALEAVRDRSVRAVEGTVREGRPAEEIVAYAREVDADLLALGTRGRHGEHRLLLGSVAEEVVRTSPVPVLTVRRLEED